MNNSNAAQIFKSLSGWSFATSVEVEQVFSDTALSGSIVVKAEHDSGLVVTGTRKLVFNTQSNPAVSVGVGIDYSFSSSDAFDASRNLSLAENIPQRGIVSIAGSADIIAFHASNALKSVQKMAG